MKVNDRVQAHPATDSWMQGDRYGVISKIGRKYIHVLMDRSCRICKFAMDNVIQVEI
jgi:hypothetical protein